MRATLRRLVRENIDLSIIAQPDLGIINADPGQIQQILMNLVVNARDAMLGGGKLVIETANANLHGEFVRDHPALQTGSYIMLTDVIMPGMSGKELVLQLKTIRPDIEALYISGYIDNAIVHHGILDSGVTFLQKPFTAEGLARKVREVIGT